MSLGQYGIGGVGVFVAWSLIPRVGRRTLYVYGQAGLLILLVVIGGLGTIKAGNVGAQWGIGAMLLIFVSCSPCCRFETVTNFERCASVGLHV
jgi:SP family general alpha glucoside:H+ symporter-like MFS transporter